MHQYSSKCIFLFCVKIELIEVMVVFIRIHGWLYYDVTNTEQHIKICYVVKTKINTCSHDTKGSFR